MSIKQSDWMKYFPFKVPRNEQVESINFILDKFINSKNKFIILEAPLGIGKSAIAVTVSNYFHDKLIKNDYMKASYIMTTQKILQEQYVRDFPYIAKLCLIKNVN